MCEFKSKFSRSEIRRYVEHCKKQGQQIKSIEALVTTLHHGGTSDDVIETFLESEAKNAGETKEEKERRLLMDLRGSTMKRGLAAEREMKKRGLSHS